MSGFILMQSNSGTLGYEIRGSGGVINDERTQLVYLIEFVFFIRNF